MKSGTLPSELHVVRLRSVPVSYALKRSPRRRTVGLRVDRDGLTVHAPVRASKIWLESVLQEKAGWVLDKLREAAAREVPEQRWEEGARLPFMGGEISLNLCTGRKSIVLDGEILRVSQPDAESQEMLQARVVSWYRHQAMQCFTERVMHFSDKLQLPVPRLRLSNAQTRWGSCSVRGVISLNWRLVKGSMSVIDYVVAHELAHLRHLNHSASFWRLVEQLYPEYDQVRIHLRDEGWRYQIF